MTSLLVALLCFGAAVLDHYVAHWHGWFWFDVALGVWWSIIAYGELRGRK